MFRSSSLLPPVRGGLLLLALSVAPAASAQDRGGKPEKGPAHTAPPTDDPNFPLLGEYSGPLKVGENKYEGFGLQVRPVGNDAFEGMAFPGGLPGEDGHQAEPSQLVGRRAGDLVILSGERFAIFVQDDHCTIIDQEGNRLGQLERVERQSPTLGATPPQGAMVIFDGTGTEHFTTASMTDEGLLMQGADFKPMFQDFNLHLEFRLPYMPIAQGQSRGNSGVYLQSRYECQILDSFAQPAVYNGLGALYRLRKPDLNMAFPPLAWQTYDIEFTAPRWAADGTKLRDARITSWVNGVKVQDDVEVPGKTGAGKPEAPTLLPIRLQDHGDPVRFRNVWIIDRGLAADVEFPVMGGDEQEDESSQNAENEAAGEDPADQAGQSESGEGNEAPSDEAAASSD